MYSQEIGTWYGGKGHGIFSNKMLQPLLCKGSTLSMQITQQLNQLQGLNMKIRRGKEDTGHSPKLM